MPYNKETYTVWVAFTASKREGKPCIWIRSLLLEHSIPLVVYLSGSGTLQLFLKAEIFLAAVW
jgi:hypothetical protein